jgi:hypothetical protein
MTQHQRALRALLVAGSLLAAAHPGHAGSQLFKCVDGGRTVYQQQACPSSAQSEPMASSPRTLAKADAASAPASAGALRLRPDSSAASSAPAKPR